MDPRVNGYGGHNGYHNHNGHVDSDEYNDQEDEDSEHDNQPNEDVEYLVHVDNDNVGHFIPFDPQIINDGSNDEQNENSGNSGQEDAHNSDEQEEVAEHLEEENEYVEVGEVAGPNECVEQNVNYEDQQPSFSGWQSGSNEPESNDKGDQITEEVDVPAMDYAIKHPLQNAWTLWYYESDRSQSWEANVKEIASFQTVEDFWSLYNHIKPASELRQGNDYSLFKTGIKPMWEDPANKRGGRWLISLDRKQRNQELDRYWLDVILCLIGEAFENSEEVCGAVVNIRSKGDKIGIWTSDATKAQAVLEIGRKLKERLHIPMKIQLGYQVHDDLMAKNSSITKNSYTV